MNQILQSETKSIVSFKLYLSLFNRLIKITIFFQYRHKINVHVFRHLVILHIRIQLRRAIFGLFFVSHKLWANIFILLLILFNSLNLILYLNWINQIIISNRKWKAQRDQLHSKDFYTQIKNSVGGFWSILTYLTAENVRWTIWYSDSVTLAPL